MTKNCSICLSISEGTRKSKSHTTLGLNGSEKEAGKIEFWKKNLKNICFEAE